MPVACGVRQQYHFFNAHILHLVLYVYKRVSHLVVVVYKHMTCVVCRGRGKASSTEEEECEWPGFGGTLRVLGEDEGGVLTEQQPLMCRGW